MKLPVQMPVDAVPQPDLPRILSTVLFGLATLELTGIHGLAQLFWAMLAGWPALLRCGCCGARPPARFSGDAGRRR